MSQDPSETPEHDARSTDGEDAHPEVKAAYRYVDKVRRSSVRFSGGHVWYGWSIREAFLAGCSHVHLQKPESKPGPKQEERFIEFKRAFPPTALTIKADGKTLDALIEKECISLFDVDRILREQVPVEGVVHGDTDFQVQRKEDPGIIEPDPSSFTGKRAGLAPSYDWEVRDCVGRQWREGTANSFDEAKGVGRAAMAAAPPSLHPCKLQVCARRVRVLLETSSDD